MTFSVEQTGCAIVVAGMGDISVKDFQIWNSSSRYHLKVALLLPLLAFLLSKVEPFVSYDRIIFVYIQIYCYWCFELPIKISQSL